MLRFAISRIHKAELSTTAYKIPADFNFNTFIGSSFGIMTEDTEHSVKISFNETLAPYITERQWHPKQKIQHQKDGSVVLTFNTNSLFEVKRWVLSWGAGARVLEPESLIQQIQEDLKGMLESYR